MALVVICNWDKNYEVSTTTLIAQYVVRSGIGGTDITLVRFDDSHEILTHNVNVTFENRSVPVSERYAW